MGIVANLTQWTKDVFAPLGSIGLFILAFMESSFFPIPPDILLIILSLENPELALWFALVCTIGSTLGGMFGYFLGDRIGWPLLHKVASEKNINRVQKICQKYEVAAVWIAGFSPIPYKVFTITAGILKLDFWKFVLASFFSRGPRFFIEAILIMLYGQAILDFIDGYFGWLTLVVAIIFITGYLAHLKIRR